MRDRLNMAAAQEGRTYLNAAGHRLVKAGVTLVNEHGVAQIVPPSYALFSLGDGGPPVESDVVGGPIDRLVARLSSMTEAELFDVAHRDLRAEAHAAVTTETRRRGQDPAADALAPGLLPFQTPVKGLPDGDSASGTGLATGEYAGPWPAAAVSSVVADGSSRLHATVMGCGHLDVCRFVSESESVVCGGCDAGVRAASLDALTSDARVLAIRDLSYLWQLNALEAIIRLGTAATRAVAEQRRLLAEAAVADRSTCARMLLFARVRDRPGVGRALRARERQHEFVSGGAAPASHPIDNVVGVVTVPSSGGDPQPVGDPEPVLGKDAASAIVSQGDDGAALGGDLVWRIVKNAKRRLDPGRPLWAAVTDATGFGSTTARTMCVEAGEDPDHIGAFDHKESILPDVCSHDQPIVAVAAVSPDLVGIVRDAAARGVSVQITIGGASG